MIPTQACRPHEAFYISLSPNRSGVRMSTESGLGGTGGGQLDLPGISWPSREGQQDGSCSTGAVTGYRLKA